MKKAFIYLIITSFLLISCSNKEGDSIAVISGEKKSVKLLVFKHADIPFMQKGRGVTLQKFKSGKTFPSPQPAKSP